MRKRSADRAVVLILVSLLALLPVLSAKPTKAVLNVTLTWDVVADGMLDNATMEVSVPSDSANQKVLSQDLSDLYVVVPDTGESRMRFSFNGARTKRVTGSFIIQTDYVDRYSVSEPVPGNELTGNTPTVIITPEIQTFSDGAFGDLSFPQDVVSQLNWTFSSIKYNESYTDVTVNDIVGVTETSDWVFKNRVGVCDELSNMFAALTRADGRPTRMITGYAYVDGKWTPHAWTEIYYSKYGWMEADPTYNQFLNLNAMRVRIGTAADIEDLADVINATSKDAKSISLESSADISVISYSEYDAVRINVVFLPQPPLAGTQPVVLEVTNTADAPVFTNFVFVPPLTVECRDCQGGMMLDPNQTKEVDLTLSLPQLEPNVKYTFPSTVMTDYGRTDVSFERMLSVLPPEEKYLSASDLPVSFKLFIGLFLIGAVALVAAAILLGW